MKDTISVVIITKNEERNIRECLESVKWADEIIVVDDCSTDNTVRICQNYTDKIYLRKLQGFGEQKQFGLEQASSDWVLFLDADERVTPQLKEEIQDVLQISPNYDGFY
ncbi:MAG: glycosyltransferase family 2 protein, partial [Candidatus Omnitrophica bacterium]|nr:glycosyltransferase family 2 protein [Candidatus Omnitrophota bacterium]